LLPLFANSQSFGTQFLADTDPAVTAFFGWPKYASRFRHRLHRLHGALYVYGANCFFSPTATAQVGMLISEAISAGPSLNLADPRIIAGVNEIVTLDILTQGRATQVLAETAPQTS
jgi:hypothetical protein